MRQFSCGQCRSIITVHDEQLGTKVICGNCNTRQVAPLDASVSDASVATLAQPPYVPPPQKPYIPKYSLVLVAGYIFIAGGVVTIFVGIMMALSVVEQGAGAMFMGLLVAVNGAIAMGIGQLLHCVRDMAQHSWENRAWREGTLKPA